MLSCVYFLISDEPKAAAATYTPEPTYYEEPPADWSLEEWNPEFTDSKVQLSIDPDFTMEDVKLNFVEVAIKLSKAEYKYCPMPVSVKAAQTILETGHGTSELCNNANNHFGIKCTKGYKSHYYTGDDCKDKEGKDIDCCFKAYDKRWDSFRDHSNLIKGKRYKHLFKHGNDYKAWCKGLKKAKYATSKTYDKKLIRIIEQYKLYRYDI